MKPLLNMEIFGRGWGDVCTGPVEMHLWWFLKCDRILRTSYDLGFLWHVFSVSGSLKTKESLSLASLQRRTRRAELGYAISNLRRDQLDDGHIVLRWPCLNRYISSHFIQGKGTRQEGVVSASHHAIMVLFLLDRVSCMAYLSERGRQEWLVFMLLS